MRAIPAAILLLAFAGPAFAQPETFSGRVTGVEDGDTLSVSREGAVVEVRLDGIDAPEVGQPFGDEARKFVIMLVLGKTAMVIVRFAGRRGRAIAEVILPDGRSLNQEVVRAGYAWHFTRHSTSPGLVALEEEARDARRGLWTGERPVPPWEWDTNAAARRTPPAKAPAPAAEAGEGAPGAEAPAPAPAPPVVGNRRSRIYHWPGCPGYSAVARRNRVEFPTRAAAEAEGYRAARNCP